MAWPPASGLIVVAVAAGPVARLTRLPGLNGVERLRQLRAGISREFSLLLDLR
jgi:hypothetical protein